MRIIFLDIDGVILPFNPANRQVALDNARRVTQLAKECNASVVISSSWRVDKDSQDRGEVFDWETGHDSAIWVVKYHWLNTALGLDVPVVGTTPLLGPYMTIIPGVRGQEIQAWLDAHPEVTEWVALDDFPQWIGPDLAHRTVACEGNHAGFDEAAYIRAKELFNAQP